MFMYNIHNFIALRLLQWLLALAMVWSFEKPSLGSQILKRTLDDASEERLRRVSQRRIYVTLHKWRS